MFAKTGGHNRVSEYRQNQFPDNELSIHTWMDADLRELSELVKQTQSSARGKDATMEFSLVYPDKRGINVMKVVCAHNCIYIQSHNRLLATRLNVLYLIHRSDAKHLAQGFNVPVPVPRIRNHGQEDLATNCFLAHNTCSTCKPVACLRLSFTLPTFRWLFIACSCCTVARTCQKSDPGGRWLPAG